MIKRLYQCVGEYKKESFLAPFFIILESLLEVLIPFLMANIIDKGIAGGNINYIFRMGVILAVCAMASLFLGVLAGSFAARASSGFAKNVRKEMYHRIQDFSFANIDKFNTSSLVTRLTTDVTNLQNSYQMILRMLMRSPAMLIFALFFAVRINPRLSLVFLLIAPILIVGLYFIITNAHPIFRKVFKTYDKLNQVVQENIRGIRVVKSYVREEHEKEKFEEVATEIYRDFSKAEKLLAFNMPLMQFAMYSCMLLLSWFGASMIVSSTMTTGQLMSLFTYAAQILMSLMMVSMVFVMITISRASAERVVEVLNEVPSMQDGEAGVETVKDGSIQFKDVAFGYSDGDKLCLDGINLDIKSGQTIGIIGGTGSSKTSLVQLIPRLYDVARGQVLVGGVDVRDYKIQGLRSEVAMVLQKNVLFSGSIKENLRWGNKEASDEELIRVCKLAQADGFISDFPDGYDTHIEQGGANVSGGQKQRLCIARALLKKPKILILDDSTSAVDTRTDALIRKAFKEEIPNTTKIIIAQRISSVEDADQIIVLDNGHIHGIGNHETLLKENNIYQEVYYSQQKGGVEDEAVS